MTEKGAKPRLNSLGGWGKGLGAVQDGGRGSDVEAISVTILPRATVSASLLKSDTLVLVLPTLLPSPHTHDVLFHLKVLYYCNPQAKLLIGSFT